MGTVPVQKCLASVASSRDVTVGSDPVRRFNLNRLVSLNLLASYCKIVIHVISLVYRLR